MSRMKMIKEMLRHAAQCFKRGDITSGAISLAVASIIVIGVGIPITQQVIDGSNLTGITATVVSFVPVLMATALLLGAVQVMRGQA